MTKLLHPVNIAEKRSIKGENTVTFSKTNFFYVFRKIDILEMFPESFIEKFQKLPQSEQPG